MTRVLRIVDAYYVPWWPAGSSGIQPAEVEYIGPWPDGGTGACVKRFDAPTVAESNQLARTWALALEAGTAPPIDRGEFWELAA